MIENFSDKVIFNFFFILILNSTLFYILNLFILKKNLFVDIKNFSSHKQLINSDAVPISGGIIILLNSLFFNFFNNTFNQFLIFGVFIIGLLADIQKLNSPLKRLTFQLIVIFIFVLINELFIKSIRIPIFDFYLNYNLVSIIFTSFCFLILLNGSNFIDGSNLQCSGYYFAILTILLFLNTKVDVDNIEIVYVLYPTLLSFIFFNFFNKSYLGDGGSYLLSFIIGFILIHFHLNQNVSPYLIVLFLWYPAFENLFSILRRLFSKNLRPDRPDLLHLHHLLFQFINAKYQLKKYLKFSIAGIVINSYNLVIFYVGSFFIYSTTKLLILIFISVSIYLATYFLLLNKLKLMND
mgnify:CR=1 FL=1